MASSAEHSNASVASAFGNGRHLSETSVMTPSVPSAPVIRRATSKPATFFMTGRRTTSPGRRRRARARRAPGRAPRPHTGRRGPDNPLATAPPSVAAFAEMRRLERQHLSSRAHRALDRGQRRSRARRDHEFGRLVVDDAGVDLRVEDVARRQSAVEILGSAAADAQRRAGFAPRRGSSPAAPRAPDPSPPSGARGRQLVAIQDAAARRPR